MCGSQRLIDSNEFVVLIFTHVELFPLGVIHNISRLLRLLNHLLQSTLAAGGQWCILLIHSCLKIKTQNVSRNWIVARENGQWMRQSAQRFAWYLRLCHEYRATGAACAIAP